MKQDKIKSYTIICPYCEIQQTAFIKYYDLASRKEMSPDPEGPEEPHIADFAIKCAWSGCAKLITGDDLYTVTGLIISQPVKWERP